MNSAIQSLRQWSWLKRSLFWIALITFITSSFLFLTPPGGKIRDWLAQTVITTQHRSWAWIFVGAERRDLMVREMQQAIEDAAVEKQDMNMIQIRQDARKKRSIDELIKVEDISGKFWKGKKLTVYDPKTIRVMTPHKPGEGERISSMVTRTGAVAGVNGGGFTDPEGLGNGFAAIGAIFSGGEIIFNDQDGSIPQHIVGFTKDGTLVVGKYDFFQLRDMGISDAVSFYPRLIANGKPLITSGDGGWGRGPRTAVGQKADGTVIFLIIDGRQAHSVGATLKELQDLLLEDGVVNAGNLDGGASSELVVDGDLLTKPSSRYGERRLPSAFLVYDDPSTVVADKVWENIDKIDPGGSYDHPDYLREQAELKAKGQLKPATPTPPPAKTETKTEPKTEPKTEVKTEPKTDPKQDGKNDSKTDPKNDANTDPAKQGAGTNQSSEGTKTPPPVTPPKDQAPAGAGSGTGAKPDTGGTPADPGHNQGQVGTGGATAPGGTGSTGTGTGNGTGGSSSGTGGAGSEGSNPGNPAQPPPPAGSSGTTPGTSSSGNPTTNTVPVPTPTPVPVTPPPATVTPSSSGNGTTIGSNPLTLPTNNDTAAGQSNTPQVHLNP
ncbi:phosphodiester glycosidase family protein [Paenibacillus allorhizosphaerae]|uniref:Phosphodiester glycosidase domain-containing protein n=1 Tax=Paenibacillus allorhizosphaerae TaxID=2849866 RepID=A0ABN7TUE8_9BACL|nr:phosphodiester glycosidase family protein [Paenibacillus allorhizosphaerae]CAG7655379.1 hypothetical protein PAECIP111802_06096 [Paenibacillus allorhizosphaerae]